MLTCDSAIISNWRGEINYKTQMINYHIQKNKLKQEWLKLSKDRSTLINKYHNAIDEELDKGHYIRKKYTWKSEEGKQIIAELVSGNVDTWFNNEFRKRTGMTPEDYYHNNIVHRQGIRKVCDGGNKASYCTTGQNHTKHCCECGRRADCSKKYGCNWKTDVYQSSCDERANDNIFSNTIKELKLKATANIDGLVDTAYNNYKSYSAPSTYVGQSIGCCQSILLEDIKTNGGAVDIYDLSLKCNINK